MLFLCLKLRKRKLFWIENKFGVLEFGSLKNCLVEWIKMYLNWLDVVWKNVFEINCWMIMILVFLGIGGIVFFIYLCKYLCIYIIC